MFVTMYALFITYDKAILDMNYGQLKYNVDETGKLSFVRSNHYPIVSMSGKSYLIFGEKTLGTYFLKNSGSMHRIFRTLTERKIMQLCS